MYREIIAEYPAYKILAAQVGCEGMEELPRAGGRVCILKQTRNHGVLPYLFEPGNVMRMAIESNDCLFEALDRANARGEEIYWLNPCSVMIMAEARKQEVITLIEIGKVYRYCGKAFRVEANGRDHLKLVEVDMAAEVAKLKAERAEMEAYCPPNENEFPNGEFAPQAGVGPAY